MPPITFTDDDYHAPDPDQDDPMVITAEIAQYEVNKVLIDQGSSVNILYWRTFQQMDLPEDIIMPFGEKLLVLQVKGWTREDMWTCVPTWEPAGRETRGRCGIC